MNFKRLIMSYFLRKSTASRRRPRDLVLGTNKWNRQIPIVLKEADRHLHLGIVGLSGVGKTYFLENLVRQDVDRKTGFVLFDVHGDLAESVVAYLAESAGHDPEILERTVLIEPFDPDYSIGFNPLERTPGTSPLRQAQELAHILRTRWETHSFGPRTEELLRNALYVLSNHGLTLLELPVLLVNRAFRQELLKKVSEQPITDYWNGRYEPLSDAMKAVVREPLLTRVSAFLADPQVRDIVGQEKSTFTFQEAIDKGQFVIANLSKGKLGEENSPVLGSLLFTKLELETFAQSRVPESDRHLFAVYADELQNFIGRNFSTLIAEARKYRIAITAGHQSWKQLTPEMRNAMLGVGSRVYFRLHHQDARELAGELPGVSPATLLALDKGQAIFRTTSHPPVPLAVSHHPSAEPTPQAVKDLRSRARELHAAPRRQIHLNITRRYHGQVPAYTNAVLDRG